MQITIDYQRGFLTGYSGGFINIELMPFFENLFKIYPCGCIWSTALATNSLINKN